MGLGLFGVLALTAAALRLTTPLKDDTAYDLVFTEKDKYVMSSDRNLIIFSMDAVSADAFERVLDKYPEYREAFTDFRYFDDTLCAYPFTSRSLPFTLTGEWFENREPFQEYQNRSYGTSRLLNRLWDEDYDVGIYLPDYQLSAEEEAWGNIPGNYISYGADQVERNTVTFLRWNQNGITYIIMDPSGAEDTNVLFAIAEELLNR